jgi:anaerobic magnesium-protoporphyrin IX monomethyl ester cyclase
MMPETSRRGGGSRVLLVKPDHNIPTRYHEPPLGVLSLAAYLRQVEGAEVRVLHFPVSPIGYDGLAGEIRSFRPSWIGVSAVSFESRGLHRVARTAKETAPDVPVVVGGPHATFYTSHVMADPNIDYAVLGEGELTAADLSRALREGGPVAGLDGLAYREDGKLRVNPRIRYVEDLDALPFPARELVDLAEYAKYERMSRFGTGTYSGLMTSRACPFKCTYCHQLFGKKYRKRSPENVLAELRELHDRYGVRELEVVDDCFNLDLGRAKRIFELIIRSGMKLTLAFPNGIRGDHLDEEFLDRGRRAGVAFLAFPVETASSRLQEMVHKRNDLEKIDRNIALACKHGIFTHGFFMLGFPTETREEMQATIDYAVRSELHSANFITVVPFEGTEMAEQALKMGKPVYKDFDQVYLSREMTNLTDIPDEEIRSMRRMAVLRFWLRPERLVRLLRDYPYKAQFPKLAVIFVKRALLRF